MFLLRRVVSPIVGVGLLGLVVWLGLRSGDDSSYIVWFGLASAILAPVGLACIGLAFLGDDQVLRELSSVPEIQQLIARADTEQERVQLLEEERQHLAAIILVEARRQVLEERRAASTMTPRAFSRRWRRPARGTTPTVGCWCRTTAMS